MNAETAFQLANLAVLPAWALLAVLPGWRGTQVVAAMIVPLLLAAAYILLLGLGIASEPGGAEPRGFGSIDEVRGLLSTDLAFTAGWFHYLAFDLFVGAWEVREAHRLGMPHWLVLPCLALTFMLGPAGLLLFYVLSLPARRRANIVA